MKKLLAGLLFFVSLSTFSQFNLPNRHLPYHPVNDYTSPTWSAKSFNFDATNNIFTGDATASTIINNAIVGSNKQFTISFWIKRNTAGVTQPILGRDNSTTAVRQFLIQYTSTNLFQITLFTNSTNRIQYNSTGTFTELREWNNFTIVYDGTLSATSRLTVYRNGIAVAGTTTQTGTFTTINNTAVNPIEIGARSNAATWGDEKINQLSVFSTNLSAANVALIHNNRVPFDVRTNSTLNASLVLFLSADNSAVWTSSWAWTDLVGSSVFTSSGIVQADQVADAPALKQIKVIEMNGQSNMEGRVSAPIYAEYSSTLTWCKVWDSTNFVSVNFAVNNNQLGSPSSQYGCEFFLGSHLNLSSQKTVYLFKYGVGASYLDYGQSPSWSTPNGSLPGGGGCWIQLVSHIATLKEWELANGYTVIKIGIVWIQGEADAQTSTSSGRYESQWTNFLTGGGASSIITGKIIPQFYIQPYVYDCLLSNGVDKTDLPYWAAVNTAKTNVQATNPTYYRTFVTNGAELQADSIHYTRAGFQMISLLLAPSIIADGF